jgi:hypothetical protein
MRDPLLFGAVKGIGHIFILFVTLFITASSALIGYLIITMTDSYEVMIFSPVVPTIVI